MPEVRSATLFTTFHWLRSRLGSLRLRIVGLLLLALLPAFALMVLTASESRRRAIGDVQTNMLRLTELAVANQRQLIDGARDILITLAQIPAIQSQDRAACLFFLSNVLMQHPLYANFGAADGAGNVYCMTLPQRMPFSVADQKYFQHALLRQEFTISEYQISPTNSQAIITLAYPIIDAQGRSQGIVFANLDLRWLGQFMAASSLPVGSTLRVVDPNGVILASYPSGEIEIGQTMPETFIYNLILNQNRGLVQGYDAQNEMRFFAFTPLYASADSYVYMIISVPTEATFAESDRNLWRNLIALAMGAILALGIAWLGTQFFLLRQVNALVKVTRRLSTGDLSARASWSPGQGELDHLAQAFNEMADALQRREQEQQWAQAQIRRQTARAEALARIAGHLNAKLELGSVLQAVCEETSRALNVSAAGVIVYHQAKEDLSHISGPGLTAEGLSYANPPTRAALEKVANKITSNIMQIDLQAHPHLVNPQICQWLHARYLICTDLVHEGNLIGRLDLFIDGNAQIGEDELTLLKGIADESALAITNARLYTALQLEERTRAHLLHQVIRGQEEERMRISRELHDETSQSLTALLVGLDTIRIAAQSDISRVDAHIEDLKSITEDMLDNVHRLIADLRPSLLDNLGLVAAIQWYGEQRLKPMGLAFHLEDETLNERLPPPVETVLFRIVQEGFTNILRHAKASSVVVRLKQDHDLITLEISDDGVGFDPQRLEARIPGKRGLGLRGIRERAAILDGSFELDTAPGKGTTVRICFDRSKWVDNPL